MDGKAFVTARGWEDLSRLIQVYEELGNEIDREVVHQYLQHGKIAKDFANYYALYKKYKEDYGIERILQGQFQPETIQRLKFAAFDEKLSVVELLNGKLSELFKNCWKTDTYVTQLFSWLKQMKARESVEEIVKEAKKGWNRENRRNRSAKRRNISSRM